MRSLNQLVPSLHITAQPPTLSYRVTDRLHGGRTVRVSVDGIASTVSTWLAELGADSPMVDDLADAVRTGDWPRAHALAEHLSVDLTVAV